MIDADGSSAARRRADRSKRRRARRGDERSSGEPKGVVLTHDAVRGVGAGANARLGVGAGDHWLACLPLAHVGGLTVVTKSARSRYPADGRADVRCRRPWRAARAGATLVSLVATALRPDRPARFRRIVLGGSRPPADLPANVVVTYG